MEKGRITTSRIFGLVTVAAQAVYAVYSFTQQNYIIMLECIAGIFLVIVPGLIDKKWRLNLPEALYIFYYIFIFAAIFLGSGLGFYSRISGWDDILHSLSGALLTALGFSIMLLYNDRSRQVSGKISAGFMAVFAFSFALAIGAVWEIYEYVGDGLMNMSMQRFLAEDGSGLVGRTALYDTMKDIIVDASSALIASIVGGFAISRGRKKKGD